MGAAVVCGFGALLLVFLSVSSNFFMADESWGIPFLMCFIPATVLFGFALALYGYAATLGRTFHHPFWRTGAWIFAGATALCALSLPAIRIIAHALTH